MKVSSEKQNCSLNYSYFLSARIWLTHLKSAAWEHNLTQTRSFYDALLYIFYISQRKSTLKIGLHPCYFHMFVWVFYVMRCSQTDSMIQVYVRIWFRSGHLWVMCVCWPIHTLFPGTLLPSAPAVRLGEGCPDSCLMDPSVVAQYR